MYPTAGVVEALSGHKTQNSETRSIRTVTGSSTQAYSSLHP